MSNARFISAGSEVPSCCRSASFRACLCSPWLNGRKYIDPGLMHDGIHLHNNLRQVYFEVLEDRFGYISDEAGSGINKQSIWDGKVEHFIILFREFMQHLTGYRVEEDTELLDSGVLSSLQFVTVIAWLEQTCGAKVNLAKVHLQSFRSARSIFDAFLRGTREDASI